MQIKENLVCCTPDGKIAITASKDAVLRIWDLEHNKCIKSLYNHQGAIKSVCCTPDGKIAVSVSDDRTLCVWDLCTGECKKTIAIPTDYIYYAWNVCCTPNGKLGISVSTDKRLRGFGTVRVWDLESGKCKHKLVTIRNGLWVFAVARMAK